jgi:hypothetical protein
MTKAHSSFGFRHSDFPVLRKPIFPDLIGYHTSLPSLKTGLYRPLSIIEEMLGERRILLESVESSYQESRMFQKKSPAAPAGPVKQLDLDICLALTGKPVSSLTPGTPATDAGQSMPADYEPQQWLMIPTSSAAMRLWVKQVQSRVVQVRENVKARMAEASAQMGARMVDAHQPNQRRKAG